MACSHVYLYRDAHEILRSTTLSRTYNPSAGLAASHIYTSMLKIMESQLLAYPDRTRGCLGFFDDDHDATEEWKTILRQLWGWQGKEGGDDDSSSRRTDDFDAFLERTYKKPTGTTTKSKGGITTEKDALAMLAEAHRPYWELFRKAHERTLQVCRDGFYNSRNVSKTVIK